MKGTNTQKLNRNILTIIDDFLDQNRVNVCEHMVKMVPPVGLRDRELGGAEGKFNGNYLRLIPGLYLEDRMN